MTTIAGKAAIGAAAAVLLAGCGSSATNAGSSAASAGAAGAASVTSSAASTAAQAASPSTAAASVQVTSGPLGSYLTDGSGSALYMFASDTANSSSCSGSCASYWPPLTVSGTPTGGNGVQAGQLGTLHRADGSSQVTYAGHALYRFKLDTGPGQTHGQGNNGFGAKWWLLAPSGQPITTTSPATSPATSSAASSGSSGGYGQGY